MHAWCRIRLGLCWTNLNMKWMLQLQLKMLHPRRLQSRRSLFLYDANFLHAWVGCAFVSFSYMHAAYTPIFVQDQRPSWKGELSDLLANNECISDPAELFDGAWQKVGWSSSSAGIHAQSAHSTIYMTTCTVARTSWTHTQLALLGPRSLNLIPCMIEFTHHCTRPCMSAWIVPYMIDMFFIFFMHVMHARLFDGITKPLNELNTLNKKLIEMQSASMAEVPTKYFACIYFLHVSACCMCCYVRDARDSLLKVFVHVTKADCEMNLYLVRAKWWPQFININMHACKKPASYSGHGRPQKQKRNGPRRLRAKQRKRSWKRIRKRNARTMSSQRRALILMKKNPSS